MNVSTPYQAERAKFEMDFQTSELRFAICLEVEVECLRDSEVIRICDGPSRKAKANTFWRV